MKTLTFLTSLFGKKKVLFLNYDHKIKCGTEPSWNGFYSTKDIFTNYLKSFDVDFFNYLDISVHGNKILVGDTPLERYSFVFFGFISKNTDLFKVIKDRLDQRYTPYMMYGNTRDNDNKLNDLMVFQNNNVPHIPTILASSWNKAIEKLTLPIVVKPFNGSCGNGVVKFSTYEDIQNHLKENKELKLIQPCINNDGDYRVITLNNKVVIHSKRVAKEGEWRNNVAQGGSVVKSDLPEHILKKAEEISRILKSNIIGFDIIFDKDKEQFLFMEINAGPHYFTFMEESGVDLPRLICNYIERKLDYRIVV
jgi:RimK family alpha-L-glutamate ligase